MRSLPPRQDSKLSAIPRHHFPGGREVVSKVLEIPETPLVRTFWVLLFIATMVYLSVLSLLFRKPRCSCFCELGWVFSACSRSIDDYFSCHVCSITLREIDAGYLRLGLDICFIKRGDGGNRGNSKVGICSTLPGICINACSKRSTSNALLYSCAQSQGSKRPRNLWEPTLRVVIIIFPATTVSVSFCRAFGVCWTCIGV